MVPKKKNETPSCANNEKYKVWLLAMLTSMQKNSGILEVSSKNTKTTQSHNHHAGSARVLYIALSAVGGSDEHMVETAFDDNHPVTTGSSADETR